MTTKSNPTHEHISPYFAALQALRRHTTGGNILILATVLALVVANIPAINKYYFDFWNQEVFCRWGISIYSVMPGIP